MNNTIYFTGKKIASVPLYHSSGTILCHSSNKLALFGVRFKHCFFFFEINPIFDRDTIMSTIVCLFVLFCLFFFNFYFWFDKAKCFLNKKYARKEEKDDNSEMQITVLFKIKTIFLVVE